MTGTAGNGVWREYDGVADTGSITIDDENGSVILNYHMVLVLGNRRLAITAMGAGAAVYNYTWNGTSGQTSTVLTITNLLEKIDAICSVTGMLTPTASHNFTATLGNGEVALSWFALISNGGGAITKRQVQKDSAEWIDATSLAYTFNNRMNSQIYTFKARAVNTNGNDVEAGTIATLVAAGDVTLLTVLSVAPTVRMKI